MCYKPNTSSFAVGGRAVTARINYLSPEEVELFFEAFEKEFLS